MKVYANWKQRKKILASHDTCQSLTREAIAVFADGPVDHLSWERRESGGGEISAAMFDAAVAEITQWPGYQPTPLHRLGMLAGAAGVGAIYYKDEGPRFGLKSFKALGGAYAVQALVREAVCDVADLTVTCATDGNHGRSVAWGARRFGCKCVIFLHEEVSAGRERAIAAHGAEIVRVAGNYDDSVRAAAEAAAANGWHVISDTSYDGYTEVPRRVMAGYGVIAHEVVEQLEGDTPPTHLFLQGGVGGFAGAIGRFFRQKWGDDAPRLVIAEPALAACLFRSAEAGTFTEVTVDDETLMAGLSCGVPSVLGWDILSTEASDFMTVPECHVAPAMRLMAEPVEVIEPLRGDPAIEAGESAVAGLAAFLAASQRPELAAALNLDSASRVLVVGTEGATDPDVYKDLIEAA